MKYEGRIQLTKVDTELTFVIVTTILFVQIDEGLTRKCFVCDSSGIVFRQSAYIAECDPANVYQESDSVVYNITITELTPYKKGKGFCAKGKTEKPQHRKIRERAKTRGTQKYAWLLCETSLGCTISEQSLVYMDWIWGGSEIVRDLSISPKRACFCDNNTSSTNVNSSLMVYFMVSLMSSFIGTNSIICIWWH